MKIGICTFGGDGGKSGISSYIIELLNAFSKICKEDEFEIITYEDEVNIFKFNGENVKYLTFPNYLRNPLINIAWHLFCLPKISRKKKFDILFLPAGNRRLPFYCNCPTIGTVHDFSSLHVKDKYDKNRMFYIKKVLPILIRKLNHVITVSESSKKDIIKFSRVLPKKISVIPLGIKKELLIEDNVKDFDLTKLGIKKNYILYISRLEHPGKNHIRLIKAYELLRDSISDYYQLVLAGSDWLNADVIHLEKEKNKYREDIFFTGFVANDILKTIYKKASLFVFPSLYEGFGLPVLEAMALGIPVAASNISSIPEVAGNSGLLFNPYDVKDIANSMKKLIVDKELRKQKIELGLKEAKNFSWEKAAIKTIELIKKFGESKDG